LGLPPEEFCLGVSPRKAANSRGPAKLDASSGGGFLNEGALARVEGLARDCPTIVDGRIEPAQFDFLQSHGVELAVVVASLFDTDDLLERAKGLEALASA
jgi:hypothetical protein